MLFPFILVGAIVSFTIVYLLEADHLFNSIALPVVSRTTSRTFSATTTYPTRGSEPLLRSNAYSLALPVFNQIFVQCAVSHPLPWSPSSPRTLTCTCPTSACNSSPTGTASAGSCGSITAVLARTAGSTSSETTLRSCSLGFSRGTLPTAAALPPSGGWPSPSASRRALTSSPSSTANSTSCRSFFAASPPRGAALHPLQRSRIRYHV